MGIYLSIHHDTRNIGDAAWAAAWDDAVALLEAWPTGILGFGTRTIEGKSMPMYTRSIRFEDKEASLVLRHWRPREPPHGRRSDDRSRIGRGRSRAS